MLITIYHKNETREISLKDLRSHLDESPSIEGPVVAKIVGLMAQRHKIPFLKITACKGQVFEDIQRIENLEKSFESDKKLKIGRFQKVLNGVQKELKGTSIKEQVFKFLQTAFMVACLSGIVLFGIKSIFSGALLRGISILLGGILGYLAVSFALSQKPAQEMMRVESYLRGLGLENTGLPLPQSLFRYLGIMPLLEALTKGSRLRVVERITQLEMSRVSQEIKHDFESKKGSLLNNIQKVFTNRDVQDGCQRFDKVLDSIDREIQEWVRLEKIFSLPRESEEFKKREHEIVERQEWISKRAKELGVPIDKENINSLRFLTQQMILHHQEAYKFVEECIDSLEELESSDVSSAESGSEDSYSEEISDSSEEEKVVFLK